MPIETLKKSLQLYPEPSTSVKIPNRSISNGKFLLSGCADRAMGYSSKDEDDALLVAVEAKHRSKFSIGELQLITYLAILQENRRKAGKINIVTQGFHSDGDHFAFVCIKEDGTILRSSTWGVEARGGLGMVFSYIVAMLKTAMKSTPTVTPTSPGPLQDKDIRHFDDEVWSRIYGLMDESLAVDDDDMDDVFDMSYGDIMTSVHSKTQ